MSMPKDFRQEYLDGEQRIADARRAKLSKIDIDGDSAETQSRPQQGTQRAQAAHPHSGARVPSPAPRRPVPPSYSTQRPPVNGGQNVPPRTRPVQTAAQQPVRRPYAQDVHKPSQQGQRRVPPTANAAGTEERRNPQAQRPVNRAGIQQTAQRQGTPVNRPGTNPFGARPSATARQNGNGAAQTRRDVPPAYSGRREAQTPRQAPGQRRREAVTDSDIFKKNLSDNESRAMMFALTGKPDSPSDGGNVDIIDMGRGQTSRRVTVKQSDVVKKKRIGAYIGRFFFVILTVLLFTVVSVLSAVFVIARGPSETARNLAVQMAMQSSGAKWAPGLFLSSDVVDEIMAASQNVVQDVISMDDYASDSDDSVAAVADEWANAKDGMIFETVNGSTFKAYVLLVKDPSRLFVGTSTDNFDNATAGVNIFQAVEKYGAIAAINAGEFLDNGGHGSGYAPLGLTYSAGKCVWNDNTTKTFLGFTKDNKLIVRESMTQAEADSLGIRDAVSFQTGNTLIEQNGDSVIMYYADGNTGTSQRTAIGQRKDGTIIMIVTDGRTASSLGATHNDMIDMMVSYGAVSAGMLDGGSSAMMYYQDYYTKYDIDTSKLDDYQLQGLVNNYKAFTDPRRIPTFFMVSPE